MRFSLRLYKTRLGDYKLAIPCLWTYFNGVAFLFFLSLAVFFSLDTWLTYFFTFVSLLSFLYQEDWIYNSKDQTFTHIYGIRGISRELVIKREEPALLKISKMGRYYILFLDIDHQRWELERSTKESSLTLLKNSLHSKWKIN